MGCYSYVNSIWPTLPLFWLILGNFAIFELPILGNLAIFELSILGDLIGNLAIFEIPILGDLFVI